MVSVRPVSGRVSPPLFLFHTMSVWSMVAKQVGFGAGSKGPNT